MYDREFEGLIHTYADIFDWIEGKINQSNTYIFLYALLIPIYVYV